MIGLLAAWHLVIVPIPGKPFDVQGVYETKEACEQSAKTKIVPELEIKWTKDHKDERNDAAPIFHHICTAH